MLPKREHVRLRLAPLPSPGGRGPCHAEQPQTAPRLPGQPQLTPLLQLSGVPPADASCSPFASKDGTQTS